MQIDLNLIRQLESLSKIELTDSERKVVKNDLQQILNYISMLSELDSASEPESSFVLPDTLRDDTAKKGLLSDGVFKNAPDEKDRFFAVPKTVE